MGTFPSLAATPGDEALYALMDHLFYKSMMASPENASSLGIDTGALGQLRHRLDDYGLAGRIAALQNDRDQLAALRSVSTAGLSETADLRLQIATAKAVNALQTEKWGIPGPFATYPISHMQGAFSSVPNLLDSTHPLDDSADAEAYLDRLARFAYALDDETELARHEADRGFVAPKWSLGIAMEQIAGIAGTPPADSPMVRRLARAMEDAGIGGDWSSRAAAILETSVNPALLRQRDALRRLQALSPAGDGIWRVPDGENYYAAALRYYTTLDTPPGEVHRIGVEQVAELSARIDEMLIDAGLTKGSVAARLNVLNERSDQAWEDSDAGRERLLAKLNEDYAKIVEKLPQAFATLPSQPMEIRPVPVELQDGAPLGYYYGASLDGSRPAIYWINLKDVKDWPRYSLPALTYHESSPGHHFQTSILQEEADLPMLLKTGFITSYGEGWALYAEEVAAEIGGYTGLEMVGALQSWLFRAARLVTDTGLHDKRWSLEKATRYFTDTVGFAANQSASEVRRYCVWPGQACSYKMGQNQWRALRTRAETALGDRFDVRQFHEILREGSMPLDLLEKRVDRWIERQMGG